MKGKPVCLAAQKLSFKDNARLSQKVAFSLNRVTAQLRLVKNSSFRRMRQDIRTHVRLEVTSESIHMAAECQKRGRDLSTLGEKCQLELSGPAPKSSRFN